MSKKTYSAPALMIASGGIDITQSQEGVIGGGNVYDDIMGQLGESLDSDALAWLTGSYGKDPYGWKDVVSGFDPDDQETWDLLLEFVYNGYYGG